MQLDRCFNALDYERLERALHSRNCHVPGAMMHNQLRDQRVVMRRHVPSWIRGGIDSNAGTSREIESGYQSRRRCVSYRGLGVNPAFDRVATEDDVILIKLEPLSGGNQ